MKKIYIIFLLLTFIINVTFGQKNKVEQSLQFEQIAFTDLDLNETIYSFQELAFKNNTNKDLEIDTIFTDNEQFKFDQPRISSTNRKSKTLLANESYKAFIKWSTWNKSGAFSEKMNVTFKFKNHPSVTQAITLEGNIIECAKIEFDSLNHNAGIIPEGPDYVFNFRFKNIGNIPVHINEVRSSCGCLVPSWPKDTIMPGEYGIIKGTYLTKGRGGYFYKTMTINCNAYAAFFGSNNIVLRIKGQIVARPQGK